MISPEARSAASALLMAMDLGAKGVDIRDRTQRLLYALGVEDEMPAEVNAARLLIHAGIEAGAIPRDVGAAMDAASLAQLQAISKRLGGGVNLQSISFAAARLYVATLTLARVHEGALCA